MEGMIFQNMFKVKGIPLQPFLLPSPPGPQHLPGVPDTQYLLASVAAVFTLESLSHFCESSGAG